MPAATLNDPYTKLSVRRRYEVWFVRLGLSDGSGAWWFRYLLMNPGREGGGGCPNNPKGRPVQVWATWFPRGGTPLGLIQGFSTTNFALSRKPEQSFRLVVDGNHIDDQGCTGAIRDAGHEVTWDLRWHSSFRITLSHKGWIGFSRTPHSDGVFSGSITLDGRTFQGSPIGFGVQGHNCGYRHRDFWTWCHVFFPQAHGSATTLEALMYNMPLGLRFHRAVLWHEGTLYDFRRLHETVRDPKRMQWDFGARNRQAAVEANISGSPASVHRVPYLKTDCSSSFEVANDSLARCSLTLRRPRLPDLTLSTDAGAVLEMVGG